MPINKPQLETLRSKLGELESLVQKAQHAINNFIGTAQDDTKIEGFVLNELDSIIDMIGCSWSTIDFTRLPPEAHRNDDPFIAE